MNRTFTEIILIFFLIFSLTLPFGASGDVTVVPGISLRQDESGEDSRYLRSVIRQLDRYARLAGLENSPANVTIVRSTDGRTGFRGRNLFYLPGNAADWQSDFELRTKLFTFLACHRFDLPYSASARLFAWIVCGIDAELEAAATSGQHLVANREYFLLGEFAAFTGTLPDWAAMSRAGYADDPVLREFYSSQARILLLVFAQKKQIGELLRRNLSGAAPDCFMDFYPDASSAAEELNTAAEQIIWNRYRPMPARTALQRLAALEKFMVQKVDENGGLTGEFSECSWQELSTQLGTQRSDARNLRITFAAGFNRLGRMLSDQERTLASAIASAVNSLDGSNSGNARFQRALDALKNALTRRQQIEDFFHRTLLLNTPLPDNFARLFNSAKIENLACSEEKMRFLLRILNDYSR